MSQNQSVVNASVSIRDIKVEFSGTPDAVLASINSFLTKQVPNLDLASKITVSYTIQELIENFSEFVKITPEGPRVWPGKLKLSDKDTVTLQLIAAKLGYETQKISSPAMSLAELQASTGLNPKSISSRLSELSKLGHVSRETNEEGVRYKITTQGIHWLSEVILKKLGRAKQPQS